MNALPPRRRQSGALLLSVALLLAIMAALAFSLNRAAGMDVTAVAADYDKRNAAYLAEAAVAVAKWTNQLKNCKSDPVPAFSFGGGTASGAVTGGRGKRINVVATGTTAAGTVATLVRNNVDLVDFSNPETKNMVGDEHDKDERDTYVYKDSDTGPQTTNSSDSLVLAYEQSNVLLYWAMPDIPADAEIMSAQLTMTQNGSSATTRTVSVHRMTTQWDVNAATWTNARTAVPWASPGGDYSAPEVATASVQSGATASWDVTGLVDGWVSSRLANYGMLLRMRAPGQSATFYSKETGSNSARPVLRVTFAKPC